MKNLVVKNISKFVFLYFIFSNFLNIEAFAQEPQPNITGLSHSIAIGSIFNRNLESIFNQELNSNVGLVVRYENPLSKNRVINVKGEAFWNAVNPHRNPCLWWDCNNPLPPQPPSPCPYGISCPNLPVDELTIDYINFTRSFGLTTSIYNYLGRGRFQPFIGAGIGGRVSVGGNSNHHTFGNLRTVNQYSFLLSSSIGIRTKFYRNFYLTIGTDLAYAFNNKVNVENEIINKTFEMNNKMNVLPSISIGFALPHKQ